jgi:hypothetical protein
VAQKPASLVVAVLGDRFQCRVADVDHPLEHQGVLEDRSDGGGRVVVQAVVVEEDDGFAAARTIQARQPNIASNTWLFSARTVICPASRTVSNASVRIMIALLAVRALRLVVPDRRRRIGGLVVGIMTRCRGSRTQVVETPGFVEQQGGDAGGGDDLLEGGARAALRGVPLPPSTTLPWSISDSLLPQVLWPLCERQSRPVPERTTAASAV